jgi:CubicO group peptidase (beta-lactamase class C family)
MKKILFYIAFIFTFQINSQLYFPPTTGTTWDTINPASLGWCQEKIDDLYSYLDQTQSKAFIYLKDGKIVLEKYFGTFTKDSLFVWNSAGKTLTGLAIGIAQEEGYLTLSDTTSSYLGQGWTSLTSEQENKITIRHQITMTTGLNHTGDHYCTLPECLVYIANPGSRWMYHNAPYTLLDNVIEAATGTNLNTYVNQKIRTKIGMNGFYFPSGYNNINISNARSMARFGLLMLNRGIWNTTTVLGDENYFDEMINSSQTLNPSYGYLTWLNGKDSYMLPSPDVQLTINENAMPNAPLDVFAALGKNGQIINVSPSQKIVMIRMGLGDGGSLVGNQFNDTIWQKINLLECENSLNSKELTSFSVFPNPVEDEVTINGLEKNSELQVVDILGNTLTIQYSKNTINVSFLPKGFYFVRIKQSNSEQLIRFVKE